MRFKNTLALFLILTLLTSQVNITFAQKTIDLKSCISLAQKNSDALNLVRLDIIKKGVERRQAKEGLADIRSKESTVRFSLLFNIEFPEAHGMPKEIELLMKMPKIDSEINKLNEQYKFEVNKVTFEVKNAYYDILDKEAVKNYEVKRLVDQESTYKRIYKEYLNGKANPDDVKLLDDAIKATKDRVVKVTLDFENAKAKLSKLIGMDITRGYTLKNELVTVTLGRSDLEGLIKFGLSKDYQVYVATTDRKLSEKEVNEVYNIYKNYYGSKVNIIASEINKPKIDYAALFQRYEAMLQNIDAKWQKVYVINLLFFKIKIPMRWFQGEYTALRYFENEKYPLIVALGERDKKRVAEQTMIELTTQKITDSYDTIKQMDLVILQTQEAIKLTKIEYEKLKIGNLSGEVPFAEVQMAKETLTALELAEYQAKVSLSKFIAALDFNTSGAITDKLAGSGFAGGNYDSGVSLVESTTSTGGLFWYVETPYESYKFIFGVKVPTDLQVTHFRLFDETGLPVGALTEINKTLEHLPLTFEASSALTILLYSKGTPVYKSIIEGDGYQGELKLDPIKAEPSNVKKPIGTFAIAQTDLFKSTLTLILNETINYDHYQMIDLQGKPMGVMLKKGQPLDALTLVLTDIEKYKVQLYFNEKPSSQLKLIAEDEPITKGVLVNP